MTVDAEVQALRQLAECRYSKCVLRASTDGKTRVSSEQTPQIGVSKWPRHRHKRSGQIPASRQRHVGEVLSINVDLLVVTYFTAVTSCSLRRLRPTLTNETDRYTT